MLLLATNFIPVVINHLLVMSVQETDHHCKVRTGFQKVKIKDLRKLKGSLTNQCQTVNKHGGLDAQF